MLRYLLSTLLIFSILLACKNDPDKIKAEQESKPTIKSRDFGEAVQLILDVPDFQMWLHGEVPERIPLKLIENEFITNELKLQKFDKRVRIVDSTTIRKEGIEDAIRIRLFETDKDTVRFSLYHHIEGAIMQGRLFSRNNNWNIIVDGIGEE